MTATPAIKKPATARPTGAIEPDPRSWTAKVRNRILGIVPQGQALPDRQPIYVSSWIYVFGMATLASLGVIVLSGITLATKGSTWWHTSNIGHFVNSVHLWAVELFFVFMTVHLIGKFWMAAWRGNRALTWMVGVIAYIAAIGTAFTGYLSMTNFEAQWIASEAKDGINSIGVGGFFNVLNPTQMLLFHVTLLPLALGAIVAVHLVLVRRHGVVPPIGAEVPQP
jgi:quinol-cytochrome oxidoreductase complex cytochrome b subunit